MLNYLPPSLPFLCHFSLSLPLFVLSFSLHKNVQGFVNLWWPRAPVPQWGLDTFPSALAKAKGQRLIYSSELLPWDFMQAAAKPPQSPGLHSVSGATSTWSSSSYPIPSVGTQVCTQLRWWEMSLLLSSLKKLQAEILQALPLLVSRVNLTFSGLHLGIVRHFVLGPSVHEQLGWGPITSSVPTCAPWGFSQGFCSQQNNSETLSLRTIQPLNLLFNLPVSLGFLLVPPAGSI